MTRFVVLAVWLLGQVPLFSELTRFDVEGRELTKSIAGEHEPPASCGHGADSMSYPG